jgi:NADPH:quinone reductase-like Zn-dependent oxidoreductase
VKTVELSGYEGLQSLRVVEIDKPKPGAKEILIEVRAAGINYAEIELTNGRYRVPKQFGFNFPSLQPQQIAECVPDLLKLISHQEVKLFANTSFPLADVRTAFEALSSRRTIGNVVLMPNEET